MTDDACKACMLPPLLQTLARATAALCLVTLLACASTPPPNEQVAAARAMVAQAVPLAVREGLPELKLAQGKLARAEDALQRGNYFDARVLAEQAEVDARYAWTLAESARIQRAAVETGRPQ